MFPLGKTGGLIEALAAAGCRRRRSRGFPLGKTGGLIEARGLRARQSRLRQVSAG